MNNELEQSLSALRGELDNSPLIQEYLTLKGVIESDEELKKMRDDVLLGDVLHKAWAVERLPVTALLLPPPRGLVYLPLPGWMMPRFLLFQVWADPP